MLNSIHEERVRAGQADEALCFVSDLHPKSEVAAQKSVHFKANGDRVESWNIYYVSSRASFVIDGGLTRKQAEEKARVISDIILNSANPYKTAKAI